MVIILQKRSYSGYLFIDTKTGILNTYFQVLLYWSAYKYFICGNSLINVDFFMKKKYILCSTILQNRNNFTHIFIWNKTYYYY